jgi:phage terminase small subunit
VRKQAVAAATMQVGKKGKGKHWTKAQVDARQSAADRLTREKPSKVTPPDWLSKDALIVWKRKLDEVAGLKASEELLDVLDREMLAVYCDAYVQYQKTAQKRRKNIEDVKGLQTWARIIGAYADKLGFNPSARARLVKKIADEKDKDGMSKFD